MATLGQETSNLLTKRSWLIPVDDSDASEEALQWTLDNLFKKGDEIHFFHVVPLPVPEMVGGVGLGGVGDFIMADPDPKIDQKHIRDAQEFIQRRYIPRCEAGRVDYKIEIVHFGTDCDSVGAVICQRAEKLNAAGVVMAKHNRGRISEFFLGSVTKYCTHHSKQPVVVLH
ncbi:hypothetical protein WJX72_005879 [[Myrmecia] bisecta]|uniref:UspA domain-containing protein n=1 Tax=[Myrmecia] bisecta TaxID=41462 RepID=A0AAW1P8L5_9CHLO